MKEGSVMQNSMCWPSQVTVYRCTTRYSLPRLCGSCQVKLQVAAQCTRASHRESHDLVKVEKLKTLREMSFIQKVKTLCQKNVHAIAFSNNAQYSAEHHNFVLT